MFFLPIFLPALIVHLIFFFLFCSFLKIFSLSHFHFLPILSFFLYCFILLHLILTLPLSSFRHSPFLLPLIPLLFLDLIFLLLHFILILFHLILPSFNHPPYLHTLPPPKRTLSFHPNCPRMTTSIWQWLLYFLELTSRSFRNGSAFGKSLHTEK